MAYAAGPKQNGSRDTAFPADLALAELVATRLCHDLAGLLGSVTGALELLETDPDMRDEALPVASDGARLLASRLRLLRFAWGGSDPQGDSDEPGISLAGFHELAAGLPQSRRVTVRLDGLAAGRCFTAAAARVLLNVLLLGIESLQGAGVLTMAGDPEGQIVVMIEGPRAAWPLGFAAMLVDPPAAVALVTAADGHRTIQAPLTALVAYRAGIGITMLLAAQTEQAPPLFIDLG